MLTPITNTLLAGIAMLGLATPGDSLAADGDPAPTTNRTAQQDAADAGDSETAPVPRKAESGVTAVHIAPIGADPLDADTDRPAHHHHVHLRYAKLSTAEIDECMEIAAEVSPNLAARLRLLRAKDPKKFELLMRTSARQLLALAKLRREDPALYEVKRAEMRIDAVASEAAETMREALERGDVTEIAAAEAHLHAAVYAQVHIAIELRQQYIDRLRERISKLECEIEEQHAAAEQVVRNRVIDLLGDQADAYQAYLAPAGEETRADSSSDP